MAGKAISGKACKRSVSQSRCKGCVIDECFDEENYEDLDELLNFIGSLRNLRNKLKAFKTPDDRRGWIAEKLQGRRNATHTHGNNQRPLVESPQKESPNRMLLVTLKDVKVPLVVKEFHDIFCDYGELETVITFERLNSTGTQALIKYKDQDRAIIARERLQDWYIKDWCRLHVEFSDLKELDVYAGAYKEYEQPEAEAKQAISKRVLNVLFTGHKGAGKSTIGGRLLLLSGQVDDCTIKQYQRLAKKKAGDKNRDIRDVMSEIWDSYLGDKKGVTVEVETKNSKVSFLGALPKAQKAHVPDMHEAFHADICLLIISARKDEFAHARVSEHIRQAKGHGVVKFLVVVNKMDEVRWSGERYEEIVANMSELLKEKYNLELEKEVQFVPVSGRLHFNIDTGLERKVCSWYDGPCLLEALDAIGIPRRDPLEEEKALLLEERERLLATRATLEESVEAEIHRYDLFVARLEDLDRKIQEFPP